MENMKEVYYENILAVVDGYNKFLFVIVDMLIIVFIKGY